MSRTLFRKMPAPAGEFSLLHSCLCRVAVFFVWTLVFAGGRSFAVTIYDLNPEPPPAPLPAVIDGANSPVYITNSSDQAVSDDGAAAVDTLRIGAWSELHLGYDPHKIATEALGVKVAGDMTVEGLVKLGKTQTSGESGLPDKATDKALSLSVKDGELVVKNGGRMHIVGSGAESDDESEDEDEGGGGGGGGESGEDAHSVVTAGSLRLDGGSMILDKFAELHAGATRPPDTPEDEWYAVSISNGGSLTLNGGTKPLDSETEWTFKGLSLTAGSLGVLVDSGGALTAGKSGGRVEGTAEQSLRVRRGGALDAGAGGIQVAGMGAVTIDGTYRAGFAGEYDSTGFTGGKMSYLHALDGTVTLGKDASIALSRSLQRNFNRNNIFAPSAVVMRGKQINFTGGVPTLRTAMGTYKLELETVADEDILRIGTVSNGVYGNSTQSDRDQFRYNMNDVWSAGGRVGADQARNIYNMVALETPTVRAVSEAGNLNKSILEALTDGKGMSIAGRGATDRGLFEMYNADAQWGTNLAAFSTGEEFMAQLERRVDRIGAEMDRLGESWFGGQGYASADADCTPVYRPGRLWAGGFGSEQKATFEEGSGYAFRPRGVMFGYDREVGRFNVGGALAYGKGKYVDRAATENDSRIENYSAGLYGSYHSCSGLFASAQATYSHLENKLSDVRGGMRRRAEHSSYAWTLGAKLGYDKYLTDRLTLTPTAGLTRSQAVSRGHDEFLDGLGVLRVGRLRRDSLAAPFELNLGFDLIRNPSAVMRLNGTVGYAYDFYDGGLNGVFDYNGLSGATSMEVESRKPGRSRFNAGAGLEFTGKRLDFGARYDYFQRRDQKSHQARGTVGVKF